jgi:hypothetical protein
MNDRPFLQFAFVLALLTACSDATEPGGGNDLIEGDTGADGSEEADGLADGADAVEEDAPGNEFLGREPEGEENEWADCISGCAHDTPLALFDMREYAFDGLRGIIDGRDHIRLITGAEVIGPDVDLIAIRAAGRSMWEITVEPTGPGSRIYPVITSHDGFSAMSFNGDIADGSRTARTVAVAPYSGELPFYLSIEHLDNYESMEPGNWGPFVGGDEYAYIIRLTELAFEPTELGSLSEESPVATVEGAVLEQAGDIHFYRFTAPGNSEPTVAFESTGSDAFVGYLAGMKTIGGDLVWNATEHDEDGDGEVDLPTTAFRPCDGPCGSAEVEFMFAVSDWNGSAFPGEFSYNVTVTLP